MSEIRKEIITNINNSAKIVKDLNELVELTGKEYFTPCDLLVSGKWVDMK